jgi:hypothetical protein
MFSKKINMAVAFVAVLGTDLAAMQITVPYEPGFAAKNPKKINVAKSLVVAGGVCTLGAYVQKDKPSLLVLAGLGVGAFAVSYFYNNKYNGPQLVDSLLTNPQQSLNDIYKTRHEFDAEAQKEDLENEKDILKLTNKIDILVQKYEQKCPIFFFGECNSGGFFPCVFTRSLNPSYRKSFEGRVSKDLLSKINSRQNTQDSVVYTSFGCGGALSEMIILTKVLAKKPDACLDIHLIEGNNICYVKVIDYLNRLREITAQQKSFNADDVLLGNYIKSVIPEKEKKEKTEDELKLQIISNSLTIQKKYQQGIAWLTKTFPNARLSLYIHDFTDSYLEYLDKHNLAHADVVAAADIQDDMSHMRKGPENYLTLCKKTLDNKPEALNVWLAKDNFEKVGITSLSLQEVEGAEKAEFNGLSVYVTSEKL